MGRFEVSCRRFAVLSGIRQEPDDYAICVHPRAAGTQRKGTLAILAEPAGQHPSLGAEACRLVQKTIVLYYYAEHSLSLTSSLRHALESANSALLDYNYGNATPSREPGAVAVQAGGVQTRRAQVGLSVALVRPDGEGIYLCQTAPTQVYIRHNGMVAAIPEPPGWQGASAAPPSNVVSISRAIEDPDGETPDLKLVAPPLGSGPDVEADLVYRRIDRGDLLVMVSSSLARHIDSATAEQIFASDDPARISDALYTMATELGLAEAHACVLQMGAQTSYGVDTDYNEHLTAPRSEQVSMNGGVQALPPGPASSLPSLKGALKAPKGWLSRKKNGKHTQNGEDAQDGGQSTPEETTLAEEESHTQPGFSDHPTPPLLQHTPYVPAYRAAQKMPWEQPDPQEIQFDGWEDRPPALGDPALSHGEAEEEPHAPAFIQATARPDLDSFTPSNGNGSSYGKGPSNGNGTGAVYYRPLAIPTLFDPADFDEEFGVAHEPLSYALTNDELPPAGGRWQAIGERTWGQAKHTLQAMLPERQPDAEGPKKRLLVPTRLVIMVGLALAAGILFFSLSSMAGTQAQNTATTYLDEAKQLELSANQPGTDPAQKQQSLTLALEKAKQALAASPESAEAQAFISQVQTQLDRAQGITRLSQTRLLFDLDEVDQVGAATRQAGDQPADVAAPLTDIVVQGNDAYILDRGKSRIYRCGLSTRNCSVVLSAGDNAGGQQVASLVAMTLRVGSLVALDEKLTAYVFNTDNSSWQAQALGEAGSLQAPKDLASYDGNLYLLGAKPGQISKYASGSYQAPPDDWIKDPASLEHMKDPAALAIDGAIYVLLQDGRIVVGQGGKLIRAIGPVGAGAAPIDLFTSTDANDLYILHGAGGTITRLTKEGDLIASYKAHADMEQLAALSGMTVDEGRAKVYLLEGRRVYEARLPGRHAQPAAPTGPDHPQAKPTAEP